MPHFPQAVKASSSLCTPPSPGTASELGSHLCPVSCLLLPFQPGPCLNSYLPQALPFLCYLCPVHLPISLMYLLLSVSPRKSVRVMVTLTTVLRIPWHIVGVLETLKA